MTPCNWERLILNLCCICFCNFNPHLATFISMNYGLPRGDNLSFLDHKEVKPTHSPAWGLAFWGTFARIEFYLLCLLISPPHLWSIKEPGNQALTRWWFWGASTIFWVSQLAPDKVSCWSQHLISQSLTYPVKSRASLDPWWFSELSLLAIYYEISALNSHDIRRRKNY